MVGLIRSDTNPTMMVPRIFLDDTDEDRAAVQPVINQVPDVLDRVSVLPGEEGLYAQFRALPAAAGNLPEIQQRTIDTVARRCGNDPQLSAVAL